MPPTPDPLALIVHNLQNLDKKSMSIYTICLATLTLLIDAKLLTRAQVVQRLQVFHDALPEEKQQGQQGLILKGAIETVEAASGTQARPHFPFEIIEGGLDRD
jgi:hypothetical protein